MFVFPNAYTKLFKMNHIFIQDTYLFSDWPVLTLNFSYYLPDIFSMDITTLLIFAILLCFPFSPIKHKACGLQIHKQEYLAVISVNGN